MEVFIEIFSHTNCNRLSTPHDCSPAHWRGLIFNFSVYISPDYNLCERIFLERVHWFLQPQTQWRGASAFAFRRTELDHRTATRLADRLLYNPYVDPLCKSLCSLVDHLHIGTVQLRCFVYFGPSSSRLTPACFVQSCYTSRLWILLYPIWEYAS